MQAAIYKGDDNNLGRFQHVKSNTKLLFTSKEWACIKESKLFEKSDMDGITSDQIASVRDLELVELSRHELVDKANKLRSEGYPISYGVRDSHAVVLAMVRRAMKLHPDNLPPKKRERFKKLIDLPFTRLFVLAGGTESAKHASKIELVHAILEGPNA